MDAVLSLHPTAHFNTMLGIPPPGDKCTQRWGLGLANKQAFDAAMLGCPNTDNSLEGLGVEAWKT